MSKKMKNDFQSIAEHLAFFLILRRIAVGSFTDLVVGFKHASTLPGPLCFSLR
jgi:hypothetical protein